MRTISIVFAIALLPLLTGCPSYLGHGDPVAVHDKMPNIDQPERPAPEAMTPDELAAYAKLPESARKKLEGNNDKLQIYAEKMNVSIIEYNGFAKLTNQKNGLWIKGGLKDEPVPGK